MINKLYYTVELVTTEVEPDIVERNGYKTITVYEIIDNQPKIFSEIEAEYSSNCNEEIQTYLDNNGSNEEFEFIRL